MPILTKAELEAIRKRAEAATGGKTPEWYVDEEYPDTVRDSWSGDLIAQGIPTQADAEFIVYAREDIPKLLEYIDELKAELSRLCPIADLDTITTLKTEIAYRDECIAELKAEIERYENALKEISEYHKWTGDNFEAVRLRNVGCMAKQALEGTE